MELKWTPDRPTQSGEYWLSIAPETPQKLNLPTNAQKQNTSADSAPPPGSSRCWWRCVCWQVYGHAEERNGNAENQRKTSLSLPRIHGAAH